MKKRLKKKIAKREDRRLREGMVAFAKLMKIYASHTESGNPLEFVYGKFSKNQFDRNPLADKMKDATLSR